jgi:hypothetical protein
VKFPKETYEKWGEKDEIKDIMLLDLPK